MMGKASAQATSSGSDKTSRPESGASSASIRTSFGKSSARAARYDRPISSPCVLIDEFSTLTKATCTSNPNDTVDAGGFLRWTQGRPEPGHPVSQARGRRALKVHSLA